MVTFARKQMVRGDNNQLLFLFFFFLHRKWWGGRILVISLSVIFLSIWHSFCPGFKSRCCLTFISSFDHKQQAPWCPSPLPCPALPCCSYGPGPLSQGSYEVVSDRKRCGRLLLILKFVPLLKKEKKKSILLMSSPINSASRQIASKERITPWGSWWVSAAPNAWFKPKSCSVNIPVLLLFFSTWYFDFWKKNCGFIHFSSI